MRNDRLTRIILVFFVPIALTGCVSKSEHEGVVSELTSTQNQIDSLQNERDALKSDFADLEEDHSDLLNEYQDLLEDYNSIFDCKDPLGCVVYSPEEPIRIASALVLSGPNADLGLDSQYGIEIAIDFYGQLLGHEIELQSEDSGCKPEGGLTVGEKIVSDPTILGVVGTSCSGAAVSMSEVISDAGYFMISPSNTSPLLTDPQEAWNPGYLRTALNDRMQGFLMAFYTSYMLDLQSAAVIHDGDPYTWKIAEAFIEGFQRSGGEIIEVVEVDYNETDFRNTLNEIAAAGTPDVLFYPLFTDLCSTLTLQVRDNPRFSSTTLTSSDACMSSAAAGALGETGDGLLLSAYDFYFSGDRYNELVDAYRKKTGSFTLSIFHAHAFDATNLIFHCVESVALQERDGTLHIGRQDMRTCLYATNEYEGVTGTLTCDDFGDCGDSNKVEVNVLEDGEFVVVWP